MSEPKIVKLYNKIIFEKTGDMAKAIEIIKEPNRRCTGKTLARAFYLLQMAMDNPGKMVLMHILPSTHSEKYILMGEINKIIGSLGLIGFKMTLETIRYDPYGEVEETQHTNYKVLS